MIDRIDTYLGRDSGLRRLTVGYAIVGVLQGLVFAAFVPLLREFFAGDLGSAARWLIVAAVCAVACGAVLLVTSNRSYDLSIGVLTDGLMRAIGDRIAALPMGWFDRGRSGQVANTLASSVTHVMTVPSVFLQQMTVALTTPATVVLAMVFIDWRMALALIALSPLAWLAYRNVQNRVRDAQQEEERSQQQVASRAIEFAQAQAVLRAAGRSTAWPALETALERSRTDTRRTQRRQQAPMLGFTFTIEAGYALTIALGTWFALDGSLDPASLIALLLMSVRFVEPLTVLGSYGSALRQAHSALDDIGEILDRKPLPEPATASLPAGTDLTFDGVGFGYHERPVLDDLTLHVPANSMTALVGPSGAGKSTLLRLAARFWDVDDGQVRLGGIDVRDIPTAELMSRIAMVFQHVYLFDTSIADNIRTGRPDATDEQVREAGLAAGLADVVERLPDGWETVVGEGGSLLSGGERQRVAIARAFLKHDAPILLIDEATSALDGESEASLTQTFRRLTTGRTVLVVAHRLSTIAGADRIAVVADGRIAEHGTHSELLAAGGIYTGYWNDRRTAANWHLTAYTT